MTGNDSLVAADSSGDAFLRGKSEGLATAALVLAFASFINLLGLEKPLLAILLATIAFRGATGPIRTRSWWAIGIASVWIATVVIVLIVYQERLAELIGLLKDLG